MTVGDHAVIRGPWSRQGPPMIIAAMVQTIVGVLRGDPTTVAAEGWYIERRLCAGQERMSVLLASRLFKAHVSPAPAICSYHRSHLVMASWWPVAVATGVIADILLHH